MKTILHEGERGCNEKTPIYSNIITSCNSISNGGMPSITTEAAEVEEEYAVYESVQSEIDTAISLNQNAANTIEELKQKYYADVNESESDYNEYLSDAVESIIKVEENAQGRRDETIASIQNQNRLRATSFAVASVIDPYVTAKAAYNAGIGIVRTSNCPHTADYMDHAQDFSGDNYPSDIIHAHDNWAKELTQNMCLNAEIFPVFEEEIMLPENAYGAVTGSFTGSFEFTSDNSSLDAAMALHIVDYSVIYTRTSDGVYNSTYYITDYYDFDYSNYDNVVVGFANNYCYAMLVLDCIRPFNISITYAY